MATNTTVSVDSFKRGDTPTFRFSFSNPYAGFDWSGVTLDAAMTNIEAPENNLGAAVLRLNASLTTDSQGAHYDFTPTIVESKALIVGDYKIEAQLKQGGTTVATPVTVKVKVLQDYVI